MGVSMMKGPNVSPDTAPAKSPTEERALRPFKSYQPPGGFHDEWLSSTESASAHWTATLGRIEGLGAEGLEQRIALAERAIREHDITYNVYSTGDERPRLWSMDLVPLIVERAEWARLERAISQRMCLLNLILQDIYGAQRLLKGGKYPTELVFANPSFLRACHQLLPANRRFLHLYAGDIARSPDGAWWALSDRLDAASGLGYSLENRSISLRAMSDIVRTQNISPLRPFVQRYFRAIENLAPHNRDKPLVALLTPGPYNETYFEHVFLARTLGIAVVQGEDLTVRQNRVFLKTTSGMEQVDVIIRRLDSEWLDPLELRDDSLLGTPGLINAVRQGNVTLVNAPGSGVLETPAVMAFLPGICRNLLGEDLLIPSVATWWCGQKREREYVLERLDQLVIKPTFRTRKFRRAIFGPSLTKAQKAELRDRIRARPEWFTGQEMVSQSTAPALEDGQLTPKHFLWRVYMCLPPGDAPFMMPGGLGRVAPSKITTEVSMQSGGSSKDVWVVGAPEDRGSANEETVTHGDPLSRRTPDHLPSRVADNLFWMGRYLERADSVARALVVLLRALQQSMAPDQIESLIPFISGIARYAGFGDDLEAYSETEDTDTDPLGLLEELARGLLWDRESGASLIQNLLSLERTSQTVHERISGNVTPTLPGIQSMREQIDQFEEQRLDQNTIDTLLEIIASISALSGGIAENTTRDQHWLFLEVGRRIERALILARVLREGLSDHHEHEEFLLMQILDFADSTITYRRRYLTSIWTEAALDLLALDASNPRSLAYQAQRLRDAVEKLPHYRFDRRHPVDHKSLQVYSLIWLSSVSELSELNEDGTRPALTEFFDRLIADLERLSDLVSEYYFSFTASP